MNFVNIRVLEFRNEMQNAYNPNTYLLICGNKMPTTRRCNRGFFADLIACSTCFGHHYAHRQELKSIIQWLLTVVFGAEVFKLLVWCGVESYVSGLQDAATSCKPNT